MANSCSLTLQHVLFELGLFVVLSFSHFCFENSILVQIVSVTGQSLLLLIISTFAQNMGYICLHEKAPGRIFCLVFNLQEDTFVINKAFIIYRVVKYRKILMKCKLYSKFSLVQFYIFTGLE